MNNGIISKELPFDKKYIIYSNGEVFSKISNRFLKPTETHDGYLRVSIGRKARLLHRLVALTFLGESSLTVDHIDNNPKNNSLENLQYLSSSENTKKSWSNERKLEASKRFSGSENIAFKITDDIIDNIVVPMYNKGLCINKIARDIGCNANHLGKILKKLRSENKIDERNSWSYTGELKKEAQLRAENIRSRINYTKMYKPVVCIETNQEFKSASEAANFFGVHKSTISGSIRNNYKVQNLSFKYKT